MSRSYPNDVLPTLGLWVERPTALLARECDIRVVSPVPYCPPLPAFGSLQQYTRFRGIPRSEIRGPVEVVRPRFLSGPGTSLYALEASASYHGARAAVDRLWADAPFDLIHAHFIYPEGALAHQLSERYGVPFIVTEHAPWTERWLGRRSIRAAALAAAGEAAALLPVSTSVRDSIVSYAGPRVRRLRVIPVGVDEAAFELGPREGRHRDLILYVGLINFNKGIDVLLHALARMKARGRPGRLALVGGAFFRHTRLQGEQLRALAVSLGVEDRVSFLGVRPPEEVAALMRESALVVLPSRAESFGSVLVEALATGTPVVATRCGGPEDIVAGGMGELVPPDDPVALADAISSVLQAQGSYQPERLREYAISRFGLREVAEQTLAEYVAAVGGRPPATVSAAARAGLA